MNDETVTVRLSRWDAERLDRAIDKGFFTNRSDAIRAAVRRMADQLEDVPKEVIEMMEKASKTGITREMVLRDAKAAGKLAHRRK
jgi:Arc/MetJ-type ribon-helix-helix transcriptional regulator